MDIIGTIHQHLLAADLGSSIEGTDEWPVIKIGSEAAVTIDGDKIHVERVLMFGGRDLDYDHRDIPLSDPTSLDQLVKLLKE